MRSSLVHLTLHMTYEEQHLADGASWKKKVIHFEGYEETDSGPQGPLQILKNVYRKWRIKTNSMEENYSNFYCLYVHIKYKYQDTCSKAQTGK